MSAATPRALADCPLDELREAYRLLHGSLAQHPQLTASGLPQDVQTLPQHRARENGVDVSLHAQWAAWLSGAPSAHGL